MPAGAFLKKNAIAISFVLACLRISNAAEPNNSSDKLFQYHNPAYEYSGTRALADAIGFQNWPQTNIWRVAPDINKSMLLHPEKITRENKYYYAAQYGQDYWGELNWDVYRIVENDKPLPTDLPEEMKRNLFRGVAPELQNDPNFTKKYYEETLNRYRQRCSNRNAGSLKVSIYNTPSSRAAYEILLLKMNNTQMPIEMVISRYSSAKKFKDLGTISFISGGDIDFIRDNIFVTIREEGELSEEALQLARKIDSAIVKSPAFTYEQLIARRPVLSISSAIKKEKIGNLKSVSYDIITPNEVNVVDVKAMFGESRRRIEDGKIIFGREIWPVDINLTAITSELLVGQCEKTIEIPDENKESNQTEPNRTIGKLFEALTVPPKFETADTHTIAEAFGFQNWPQTKMWRVAPDVNKFMLIHPEKATTENKQYKMIQFGQDYWGSYKWSIDYLVESNEPLPAELPENMKKSLLLNLPPESRNNPDRIKEYSEKLLESYRESQKYHSIGWLNIEICNTPNSKAANEYLLKKITSEKPVEKVISIYSHKNKLTGLGTMSYVSPSYIDFIRDNIFVTISGNGELSNEVLQLAKKIDSAIVKGPELTYEQLVSRRPSFTISKDIKISKDVYFDKNQRVISYDFIIPDEVNVVNAFSKINGRPYGFTKNREIPLPHTGGPVNIKLTAITNELLVGQCEKTIEIPDVNTEAVCNTGDR